MLLTDIDLSGIRLRTSDEVEDQIRKACAANPDLATFYEIGASREGRLIYSVSLGQGPRLVTLMAGAHADEPVGPETLRTLILETLANRDWLADDGGFSDLFDRFTFKIIPHVNPDGEVRNQNWIRSWPNVEEYLHHRVREQPGEDIEFGFPAMRPENRAAARFLFDYTPIALHISLHGMGFAEGALLLIERHWADNVAELKRAWVDAVMKAGLGLHDHDRKGDKGFRYFGPGFWSTPEGEAMRQHFLDQGDEDTAAQFFHSSMEWARMAGYDANTGRHPLALVTELPLFVIEQEYPHQPGVPGAYFTLHNALPEIKERIERGKDVSELLAPFQLRVIPLETAVRLQLLAIELGLEEISRTEG